MAAEKIDALELNIESKLSVENLDKLIESLRKLGKEVDKVKQKKPKEAVKDVGDGANEAANGLDKFLGKSIRLAAVIALFRKATGVISDGISKSLTYYKTLNMFTVSLGKYAENATKYGETVSDALGIDIAGWQNAQGIFQTLITGFGVAGDKAAYMSQNLTQLSYDIASFYGITNEEAQNKLKSAISGRLEPIRKLGWDLSQSKLVDIAKNPKYYGQQTFSINEQTGAIEANTTAVDDNTQHKIVNFNQLTQQEKVQLRYIALMTQVTQVQGNMAKTLADPNNQMRIFKEQLSMTSRELGNVFIPALNQVLPYLTAFAKLAAEAFRNLANLFGFELPDMSDRMDISSVAEPYNDVVQATGAAAKNAKKLRDYTIGLDELNVLKKPDDTTGGGGGVTGENSNLENLLTPGYDFLSKAMENSIKEAKKQIEKFISDLKAHPISLPIEIFKEGASILGENFWTAVLGKTPEELAQEAYNNGTTVEWEFYKGVAWAAANVAATPFELLFGSPDELGKRAAEAGRTVGDQFGLELLKKSMEVVKATGGGWLYKIVSGGGDIDKDIKELEKKINNLSYTTKSSYSHSVVGNGKGRGGGTKVETPFTVVGNTAAIEAQKQGEAYAKAYAKGLDSGKNTVQSSGNGIYKSGVIGASNNGTAGSTYKALTTEMSKSYGDGLTANAPYAKTQGETLYKSGYNGANNDGKATSSYKYVSYDMAKAYATELASKSNKQSAYNAGKELSNQGLTGNKSHISGFKGAGEQSGAGYVAGVTKNENIKKAKSAGATIAANALKKLKEVLGIHSPSRAFGEAGMNSVLGYANYMEKYTYLAENAARDMARNSLKAVETANAYTTSNAGYGIAASNQGAMADFMSNIYNAMTSAMAGINEKGDTVIMIDGKEIFKVVKKQERESGIAIGNGAFV